MQNKFFIIYLCIIDALKVVFVSENLNNNDVDINETTIVTSNHSDSPFWKPHSIVNAFHSNNAIALSLSLFLIKNNFDATKSSIFRNTMYFVKLLFRIAERYIFVHILRITIIINIYIALFFETTAVDNYSGGSKEVQRGRYLCHFNK